MVDSGMGVSIGTTLLHPYQTNTTKDRSESPLLLTFLGTKDLHNHAQIKTRKLTPTMIHTAIHGDWVVEEESGMADGSWVVFDVEPIKTLGKLWIKLKTHLYEQLLSLGSPTDS